MSFWMVGGEFGRMLGPLIIVVWIGLTGVAGPALADAAGPAGGLSLVCALAPGAAPRAKGVGQVYPLRQALVRLRPMLLPDGRDPAAARADRKRAGHLIFPR